ncbi:hypothetical protein IG631_22458 [Alternaria alternata]|nr:hypothetical protein IG631_22458 [Alternaria alternata]
MDIPKRRSGQRSARPEAKLQMSRGVRSTSKPSEVRMERGQAMDSGCNWNVIEEAGYM